MIAILWSVCRINAHVERSGVGTSGGLNDMLPLCTALLHNRILLVVEGAQGL